MGFLSRAHPLTTRAVWRGCHLPAAVSAARHDRLALLLTYEIEIATHGRPAYRRMLGVLAAPDRPPEPVDDPLAFATTETIADWTRDFAPWAGEARAASNALVWKIAEEDRNGFVVKHDTARRARLDRTRDWLRVRADLLCGPAEAPTGDLFGAPAPGPSWRYRTDPRTRLAAFATDPEVAAPRRRDANATLEMFGTLSAANGEPDAVVCRPLGLLMLVPADAV